MTRLGAMLVAFAMVASVPAMAADSSLSQAANTAFLAANAKKPGVVTKPDGLQYRILRNGFGKQPRPQDYVTVYYTGSLINGKVFDGTEPGMPVRFKVNQLISGWSEALSLMRVGDHWQLVIPAGLAYGERGSPDGSIPPNQTLVFDLELIKVVPPKIKPHDPNDPNDKGQDVDLGPDDSDQ
ncbi:MAG: FKBP-type peptidyl-prolyl cis-trans isomerase [Alphaproteobacteria bacterium]|nr:FKBP-type peptidyl-prolyl cis-trans isomerase [Alphaproteobacteria bacterium]MDE2111928.1 FKBP-type peptidyl-prolyl cis-trans isomerase [Alphaproteobacteria bacterium]